MSQFCALHIPNRKELTLSATGPYGPSLPAFWNLPSGPTCHLLLSLSATQCRSPEPQGATEPSKPGSVKRGRAVCAKHTLGFRDGADSITQNGLYVDYMFNDIVFDILV